MPEEECNGYTYNGALVYEYQDFGSNWRTVPTRTSPKRTHWNKQVLQPMFVFKQFRQRQKNGHRAVQGPVHQKQSSPVQQTPTSSPATPTFIHRLLADMSLLLHTHCPLFTVEWLLIFPLKPMPGSACTPMYPASTKIYQHLPNS